jgi:hypothetical protein
MQLLNYLRQHPILAAMFALLVAAVSAAAAVAAPEYSQLIGLTVGFAGMGAVIEQLSEQTTPDEHKVRDVSDALTYMDESAQVPLDQMLRRMRQRKPAENVIIEWERVDRTPPRKDTIAGNSTGHAGAAKVTIDVNNAAMWRPNDIAWHQSSDAKLLVVATDSGGGTIDVYALPDPTANKQTSAQSFGTVPDVSTDDVILRVAPSKAEADAPSLSRMTTPSQFYNYVHTFDAVVTASDHRQRTKNYTKDDYQRGRADSVIDLRRSMEYNYFFGEPTVTLDPDTNELRWTMGGLLHFTSNNINYTIGSVTEADIVDWLSEIFTGNTGSRNRVLFADKNLAADIDKVMLAKMQHVPTRNIAGVMATELRTRHGRLMVVHHPGFDELGKSDFGVVVDLAYVSKAELQPMDRTKLKLKESGQKDADGEWYIEKSTLEVRNGEVHYTITGTA